MKKILSVLLICIMMFCLTACGKDKEQGLDKTDRNNYIGKWQEEYYYIQIDKGGIGSYREVENPDDGYYGFEWEIVDGVITLEFGGGSAYILRTTLELNEDGTKLELISGQFPVRKTEITTFDKVD